MIAFLAETFVLLTVAGLLGCIAGCAARRALQPGRAVPPGQARPPESGAIAPAEDRSRLSLGLSALGMLKAEPPPTLEQPREEGRDDLRQISGIGARLEETLNEMGIYHYDQIADWSRANVRWIDERLRFRGRVDREGWVPQARQLAAAAARARAGRLPVLKARTDFVSLDVMARSRRQDAEAAAMPDSEEPNDSSAAPAPLVAAPDRSDVLLPSLDGPRGGRADDLKLINGIGPKIERLLNDLGVYHFHQIAQWTEGQKAYLDEQLALSGRIERDGWVRQAKELARANTDPLTSLAGVGGNGD